MYTVTVETFFSDIVPPAVEVAGKSVAHKMACEELQRHTGLHFFKFWAVRVSGTDDQRESVSFSISILRKNATLMLPRKLAAEQMSVRLTESPAWSSIQKA